MTLIMISVTVGDMAHIFEAWAAATSGIQTQQAMRRQPHLKKPGVHMNHQAAPSDLSMLATLAGLVRLTLVLICAPALLAAAVVASAVVVLGWPLAWLARSVKRMPAAGLRRRNMHLSA
jgi:hypothetical protein